MTTDKSDETKRCGCVVPESAVSVPGLGWKARGYVQPPPLWECFLVAKGDCPHCRGTGTILPTTTGARSGKSAAMLSLAAEAQAAGKAVAVVGPPAPLLGVADHTALGEADQLARELYGEGACVRLDECSPTWRADAHHPNGALMSRWYGPTRKAALAALTTDLHQERAAKAPSRPMLPSVPTSGGTTSDDALRTRHEAPAAIPSTLDHVIATVRRKWALLGGTEVQWDLVVGGHVVPPHEGAKLDDWVTVQRPLVMFRCRRAGREVEVFAAYDEFTGDLGEDAYLAHKLVLMAAQNDDIAVLCEADRRDGVGVGGVTGGGGR